MDLLFKDNMHKKYFEDFLRVFNMDPADKELYSTVYLICGVSEFEIIGRYIDTGRKIIHLESLLNSEDFYTMEAMNQEMTRLGAAIYTGTQCDVADCFSQLKGPELKVALNALELRFGGGESISD